MFNNNFQKFVDSGKLIANISRSGFEIFDDSKVVVDGFCEMIEIIGGWMSVLNKAGVTMFDII